MRSAVNRIGLVLHWFYISRLFVGVSLEASVIAGIESYTSDATKMTFFTTVLLHDFYAFLGTNNKTSVLTFVARPDVNRKFYGMDVKVMDYV